MKKTFGLDLGTTSIGWSVIDYDGINVGCIEGLGVRIFPEACDPDGAPLNQQQRLARMLRRQSRRRRGRRKAINELLSAAGFLPPFESLERLRAMSRDPYELRRDALSRTLAPHELGRALYHLSKRRHFKARRREYAFLRPQKTQRRVALAVLGLQPSRQP